MNRQNAVFVRALERLALVLVAAITTPLVVSTSASSLIPVLRSLDLALFARATFFESQNLSDMCQNIGMNRWVEVERLQVFRVWYKVQKMVGGLNKHRTLESSRVAPGREARKAPVSKPGLVAE